MNLQLGQENLINKIQKINLMFQDYNQVNY